MLCCSGMAKLYISQNNQHLWNITNTINISQFKLLASNFKWNTVRQKQFTFHPWKYTHVWIYITRETPMERRCGLIFCANFVSPHQRILRPVIIKYRWKALDLIYIIFRIRLSQWQYIRYFDLQILQIEALTWPRPGDI